MIVSRDNRLGKPLHILMPGDYHAVNTDCIMVTVTGACVCVGLFDDGRRIGGMGNFIVPGMIGTEGIHADQIAAHGITQMEYLIGEIVKLKGDRKYLKAKLFGASANGFNGGKMEEIVESNIRFLREYFSCEKITVAREDLGGRLRRKILFEPLTGSAFRRYQMRNEDSSEFLKLEREYIDTVFRNKPKFGKVMLFG